MIFTVIEPGSISRILIPAQARRRNGEVENSLYSLADHRPYGDIPGNIIR